MSIVCYDFYTTWCGPCKLIAPYFESLKNIFTDVTFVKVNIEEEEKMAQAFDVSRIPTFVVTVDGTEVNRMSGADKQKLVQMIGAVSSIKL